MGDSQSTSIRSETRGKPPEKTDSLRLTPARRDVLLGLYEGREIQMSGGNGHKEGPAHWVRGKKISMLTVNNLRRDRLVWWFQIGEAYRTLRLTDSGRALAERLAQEGRG